MKFDIFISYSRKDFDEVSSILEFLKTSIPGLTYWFDIDGIESGDEFEDKIISAIDNSSYVLFALSENSIQSQWTKDEVMYAKNTDKKVIPILLKGAQMKGWFLFKFGRIDCIDSTNSLQMEKLIQNLSSWLGKTGVSEAAVIPEQPTLPPRSSQPENADAPLCPCGSGRLFKECHGGSVSPVPVKNLRVGDFYDDGEKQGVVFWVDDSGRYAKIISLDQAKLQWCTYDEEDKKVVTGAVDEYDGMQNQKLIANIEGWQTKYPGFAWCARHGAGWYLPAAEELAICIVDKYTLNIVNQTLSQRGGEIIKTSFWGTWFWSSTEANKLNTSKYVVSDSYVSSGDKTFDNYVRAVAMVEVGASGVSEVKVDAPRVSEVKPKTPSVDNQVHDERIWNIGDYYEVNGTKGVVFWVDKTGKHGKIVSLDHDRLRWCTQDKLNMIQRPDDYDDGSYNSQVVQYVSNWRTIFPAITWCVEHGEGWYLPAVGELQMLRANTSVFWKVNHTLIRLAGTPLYKKGSGVSYWSSTQKLSPYALYLFMGDLSVGGNEIGFGNYVRAVFAF